MGSRFTILDTILLGLSARQEKPSAIDLTLPAELEEVVQILNEQGPNRYFEWSLLVRGQEVLLPDKLVWHLRVGCVAIDDEIKENGKVIWTSCHHFQQIKKRQQGRDRLRIHVPCGLLEEISTSKSENRTDLVWNNFYFGKRHKRRIKFSPKFQFKSSYLTTRPGIFPDPHKLANFLQKLPSIFILPPSKWHY
jgi:hypothetical protein